jgi:hypothetical protein
MWIRIMYGPKTSRIFVPNACFFRHKKCTCIRYPFFQHIYKSIKNRSCYLHCNSATTLLGYLLYLPSLVWHRHGIYATRNTCIEPASVPDPSHFDMVRIRILGSIQWITDPDHALLISGFQDADKKCDFSLFFYNFLKVHLIQPSKITWNQEVNKRRNQEFSQMFCLLSEIRTQSQIRIRISKKIIKILRNWIQDPEHWFRQ